MVLVTLCTQVQNNLKQIRKFANGLLVLPDFTLVVGVTLLRQSNTVMAAQAYKGNASNYSIVYQAHGKTMACFELPKSKCANCNGKCRVCEPWI